jgi:hypothetical protein
MTWGVIFWAAFKWMTAISFGVQAAVLCILAPSAVVLRLVQRWFRR